MNTQLIKLTSLKVIDNVPFGEANLVLRVHKNKFDIVDNFYCHDKGNGKFGLEMKVDIIDKSANDGKGKVVAVASLWYDTKELTFQLLEDLVASLSSYHTGKWRKSYSRELPEISNKDDYEKVIVALKSEVDAMEENNK